MSSTQSITIAKQLPSIALNSELSYGDWRDEFFKNGYYVFKRAVSPEKAVGYYQKKALDWLQSFDNSFNLNDKSTWTKDHLPQNFKNMYFNYCATHEKYMWDARTEPGIIKRFEELWGTPELIVSFDSVNITLPGRKDADFKPWPHTDQAPERKGLACVQGFLACSPGGPGNGGLVLMVGSSALFEEYFETFEVRGRTALDAKHYDFYMFNQDDLKWFESKGCRQIQVDVDPGDLVLWDSRTIHQVALPESDMIRTVIYTCYTPAALAKKEDLEYKAELFGRFEGTTHWPHCNIWGQGKAMRDGKLDPLERQVPLEKPDRTDQILKLAGVKPY